MTSKTSYNSLGKNVRDQLHRMRSFILLIGVLYLAVGPIWLFLEMTTYTQLGVLPLIARLYSDYFTPFYILAIGMGIGGGIYATRYQDVPSQSNFYHSLPITRAGLLSARVLAVVLVQVLLLIVITVVDVTVAAMVAGQIGSSGLVGNIAIAAGINFLNVMLVFLLAFAVTLFAGQLTANTMGQILMTAVLHLTVPVFGQVLIGIASCFNHTFLTIGFLESFGRFNILTAFTSMRMTVNSQINTLNPALVSAADASNFPPTLSLWPVRTMLCYVLLTALLFLATYALYKRRAVEKAGDTLLYPLVGSVVKAIYVFFAGVVCGLFFWQAIAENILGFIIGGVIGMLVVHLIAEMLYSMDVDGVRRNYISSLVGLVCALALSLGFQSGIVDLDHHMPGAASVKGAVLAAGNEYDYEMNVASDAATDPETVEKIMTAAVELMDKQTVLDPEAEEIPNLVTVNLAYDTALGGRTTRIFDVPEEDAQRILGPLLDDGKVNQAAWNVLADANIDDVVEFAVLPAFSDIAGGYDTYLISNDTYPAYYAEDGNTDGTRIRDAEDGRARAEALLAAIQQDLSARNRDVLKTRAIGRLTYGVRTTNEYGVSSTSYSANIFTIYEGDTHAAALLAQWREEGFLADERTTLNAMLKGYQALVYDPLGEGDRSVDIGTLSMEAFIDAYMAGDILTYDQIHLYGADAQDPDHYVVGLCDGPAGDDDSAIVANYYVRDGATLPVEEMTSTQS